MNGECFADTTIRNHPTALYFMKHPWGAICSSKASDRDAKIFIIEKNSGNILDGFKGNKTGMKKTNWDIRKTLRPELQKQHWEWG